MTDLNPASSAAVTADSRLHERTLFGHPLGLFLLFFVEMWERFSYYGMRGLLVLYLIADPTQTNAGRGWTKQDASFLMGLYGGMAYLFPIFGGLIADRFIGTHRSMVVGSLLITLGHITLGVSGLGTLSHSPLGMSLFMGGLALIVLGTGHFKPTVSVMVGDLYGENDPRREGAYSIFYMGINLGAFLCAFVCGTLGESERWGWHWGFGAAAVGMAAGLVLYLFGRPYLLPHIGDAPRPGATRVAIGFFLASVLLSTAFAVMYHQQVHVMIARALAEDESPQAATPLAGQAQAADAKETAADPGPKPKAGALSFRRILILSLPILAVIGLLVLVGVFIANNAPEDRGPVSTIFVYMVFNAVFWMAFEQAASSVNIFTQDQTNRMIGKWEIPTTWFQSINAALIILLAPAFAWLWATLGKLRREPSQPVKIGLGLILLAIGYLAITWAALIAGKEGRGPAWLVAMMYAWHTFGELTLSPTGLSYVTKASPRRYVSLLMGIWFLSSFVANFCGGLIAAQMEKIAAGEITLPWKFGGHADFFFLFVVMSFACGLLIIALSPLLRRLERPSA